MTLQGGERLENEVRVGYVYLHQDDPSKSTMKKLHKFSLANPIQKEKMSGYMVIRYDAEKIILPSDRSTVARKGICIIEGSWKLNDLLANYRRGVERKLPVLMAGNPVNFGKFNTLSSVEALASALYITGFSEQAERVMSKFNWGHTFLEINGELLKSYSNCNNMSDIEEVYREFDIIFSP